MAILNSKLLVITRPGTFFGAHLRHIFWSLDPQGFLFLGREGVGWRIFTPLFLLVIGVYTILLMVNQPATMGILTNHHGGMYNLVGG